MQNQASHCTVVHVKVIKLNLKHCSTICNNHCMYYVVAVMRKIFFWIKSDSVLHIRPPLVLHLTLCNNLPVVGFSHILFHCCSIYFINIVPFEHYYNSSEANIFTIMFYYFLISIFTSMWCEIFWSEVTEIAGEAVIIKLMLSYVKLIVAFS